MEKEIPTYAPSEREDHPYKQVKTELLEKPTTKKDKLDMDL